MQLQIELWHALSLGAMLVAGFWGVLIIAAKQYDRRLTELDRARTEADKKRDDSYKNKLEEIRDQMAEIKRAQADEIRELRQNDIHMQQRLSKLEVQVAAMPTKEDVVLIHERVNEIAQAVGSLSGAFDGVTTTLGLIHRKLMGS